MSAPTTTIRLNRDGLALIREAAEANGMTVRQYMEALMSYAISTHRRPGSWEAGGFDASNYLDGFDEKGFPLGCADRWFKR